MSHRSIASPRPIELLAPAKDMQTALEAIAHGADAVYIGAPMFGARAAAGVSLQDLRQITARAHRFGVRIYVALNTILYDHELEDVERMIWDLYRAGADAIIIQDMGITMMNLPPIPLHSSTQCDTCTPEDARLLDALGFEQIVLARELNTEQIRRIHAVTEKRLEVFVHGALCVSYSGRCYLSQALTGRSANRGECSQQCRLPYDLIDSQGKLIRKDQHLLSPMDLNRSDYIEDIILAGASSLKVEGRLKNISYVKNITAYYRQRIDEVIAKYPERFCRASMGESVVRFTPNPAKSFNRGFTPYLFHMAKPEHPNQSVLNHYSPKSRGEYVGISQKTSNKNQLSIRGGLSLSNGDGLMFISPQGEVGGLRVNKVNPDGSFTPSSRQSIPKGSRVFRNFDQDFERTLSQNTAERRLAVSVLLTTTPEGFSLVISSQDKPEIVGCSTVTMEHQIAKNFDPKRIETELSKLGQTDFVAKKVDYDFSGEELFIPMSVLSDLRRNAIADLETHWDAVMTPDSSEASPRMKDLDRSTLPAPPKKWMDYRANIANRLASEHYRLMGYEPEQAFELTPNPDAELMCTKHCIRHELGACPREGKSALPYSEPLYLIQESNRLRLEFDCKHCQMKIYQA